MQGRRKIRQKKKRRDKKKPSAFAKHKKVTKKKEVEGGNPHDKKREGEINVKIVGEGGSQNRVQHAIGKGFYNLVQIASGDIRVPARVAIHPYNEK